ncbi:MAG TPA: hypothetical protein VIL10_05340 [Marmoricola sp.]|jgi:hypothetical protein
MATVTGAHAQIQLNGVHYQLHRASGRPAIVQGRFGPGDITQQQHAQDVPRIWDDFSGGGGYSRRSSSAPNGYAWCIGDPRYQRAFMPAGKLVEMEMPGGFGVGQAFDSISITGRIFLLGGGRVTGIPQGGADPWVAYQLPDGQNPLSAAAIGGGIVMGVLEGTLLRYDYTAATWARSANASFNYVAVAYWVVGGYGAARLVGAGGASAPNGLRFWPADPTLPGDVMNLDDWSAEYPVGAPSVPIVGLVVAPVGGADHAYVIKSDGIYDLDHRGHYSNLTPYWRHGYDPVNGGCSLVHDRYIYARHLRGLDRVRVGRGNDADTPEWCYPGMGLPNETPVHGVVTALALDGPWVVAALFNGQDTYICYGMSRDQPGVQPGPGPILWHMALAKIDGVVISELNVHTYLSTPWLFMAGESSVGAGVRVFRQALPKAATPLQALERHRLYGADPYPLASTATIVLPTDDWDDATAYKVLRRFDVQLDNLGTDVTAELFAQAEGGAWQSQGQMTTSPRETVIPVEPLTAGYQIGTRVDLASTETVPALLRALKARAAVSVDATEQRVYHLHLGQATEGLNRARDRRDPEVLFAQLWSLQMEGPVALRDHRGRELSVKVENVAQEEVEVPGSAGRRWEMVAVVSLTVLQRPGYWDVSLWNTDAMWSA